MITVDQVVDQKNMIAADQFFEITDVIIIRGGNVIRGVTRGVITRRENTRII